VYYNEKPAIMENIVKRILVPVDYSECSRFACRYAIKIACKLGADLRILHAYYTPAFELIELAGTVNTQSQLREDVTVNLDKTERETADNLVNDLKEYINDTCKGKVFIDYEVVPGVPEDEILRYSESYEPDLIIMGTHGKGSGMNAIIGSVTAAVIGRTDFPVMAIPEKYTFVGEENVNNILYITEFDESDFLSLKKLISLTEQLDLNIHCAHIGEDLKSWDRIKMDGLMEYFRKSYNKTQVDYSFLNQNNLLVDIDKLVAEKKINIISITSSRKNIFEKLFRPNITKTLFYHTSIPLLVFHG